MKLMLLAVALLLTPMVDQTLSPAERDHAVAELESSRKAFLEATSGLSEAQWNFKPAPDRWSIAECAEHIGVTESFILNLITEQALKGPAEPEKRTEVQGKDTSIMVTALDRSAKFKAPESIQPTRRWLPRGRLRKMCWRIGRAPLSLCAQRKRTCGTTSWTIPCSRRWTLISGYC